MAKRVNGIYWLEIPGGFLIAINNREFYRADTLDIFFRNFELECKYTAEREDA